MSLGPNSALRTGKRRNQMPLWTDKKTYRGRMSPEAVPCTKKSESQLQHGRIKMERAYEPKHPRNVQASVENQMSLWQDKKDMERANEPDISATYRKTREITCYYGRIKSCMEGA